MLLFSFFLSLALSGASNAQTTTLTATSSSYLIVLKERHSMSKFELLCSGAGQDAARLAGLDPRCSLKGLCRHTFNATVGGIVAHFTPFQLSRVLSCFEREIDYIETDNRVFKSEGFAHVPRPLTLSSPFVYDSREPKAALKGRRLLSSPEPQVPASSPEPLVQLFDRVDGAAPAHESNASQAFSIWPLPSDPSGNPIRQFSSKPSDGSLPVLNGEPLHMPSELERAIGAVDASAGPSASARIPSSVIQATHRALWNLDRLDQRAPPLDRTFRYGAADMRNLSSLSGSLPGNNAGLGVTIYVVDSGILPTHQEFSDWSGRGNTRASYGWNFVEDSATAQDCDGHGTHVSSTAVGRSVGVAKQAKVVAVKVLDCQGSGSVSDTIAGLDWIAKNAAKPAVVTLSLGISVGQWSRALEESVRSLVVEHGITVIVASGNSATDSCFIAPANVPEAITVSAANLETKFGVSSSSDPDTLYRYSNTGACVDIFAPGVDIYGACGGASRCSQVSDSSYAWASGTSMAVPHVAGAAALYLGQNPSASPQEVRDAIVAAGTRGRIQGAGMRTGSPNLLLYVGPTAPRVTASDGL